MNQEPQFSKFRALFWPIHRYELKKFLPMGFMLFCALFNYTIVRDIKDALVVKAAGAETISFIKFWAVLPLAVFFVLVYTKLVINLLKINYFISHFCHFLFSSPLLVSFYIQLENIYCLIKVLSMR